MARISAWGGYGSPNPVKGSSGDDEIFTYGSATKLTVEAYSGDDKIDISSGEKNVILAGNGNDSVRLSTKYSSVDGGAGKDTVSIVQSYNSVNGGDGDDYIVATTYVADDGKLQRLTLTGGAGSDTFEFQTFSNPSNAKTIHALITDISNEDVISFDWDYADTVLSYNSTSNGIALSDETGVINVTLQGVTDINQISGVTFNTKADSVTLGDIFSSSSEPETVEPATVAPATVEPVTVAPATVEPVTVAPATVEPATVAPADTTPAESSGGSTVVNIYGPVINIQGLTVNNRTLNISNTFTQTSLWLGNYSQFTNIVNLDASKLSGIKVLTGNSQSNFITASSGGSSLWGGGAGDNTLRGGNGSDMFWFTGSGNDVVQNFTTGRGYNSDVLTFFGTSLSYISRTSSSMSFYSSNGTSFQVNNSSSIDEVIQYSTDGQNISYAKVGRTGQSNVFTYTDGVNFYSGSTQTDFIKVTGYQSRNVWLDGSQGVGYDGIENINAGDSSGNNQLVGNYERNQITSGSGDDSLWGGAGAESDTLIGGNGGTNTYFYGMDNGNDVIVNSSESDFVNLFNVNLSDIYGAGMVGSNFVVQMNSGQSLLIQGQNGASNFVLADQSAWHYNHESHSWSSI